MPHFPLAEYWPVYLGFTVLVLLVITIDLGVFHRKAHEVSFKEASVWTAIWVSLALVFNYVLYLYALHVFSNDPRYLSVPDFIPSIAARELALQFLAGFVVEKSLAIDNIFVFAMVFTYFGIAKQYQHRILFYGILGALFFRAIFIALGSYLMSYHGVVIFFGVLLIVTGIKMLHTAAHPPDPSKNLILKLLEKVFRVGLDHPPGAFWFRKNGILYATPLLVALFFVEISDIIFSIDSVPAIFALTDEPLIVFTSNIFAILGLRSMYFMLIGVMDRFSLIQYGLAAVLIFVGLKMAWLNQLYGGKFPIHWSLGIIATLIGGSMLLSWIKTRRTATIHQN